MSSSELTSVQLTPELMQSMPSTDDRRPLVVGVLCFLWALSTIGVMMRFPVRLKRRIHGWEDYTVYLSWAIGVMGVPNSVLISRAGLGRHIIYLSREDIAQMLKWASIGQLQVVFGASLVRCSVCILILRLIERTHRKTRWLMYGTMAVNFVTCIVGVFLIGFQCRPFEKRYRPEVPGKCFDIVTLTYSTRTRGIIGCIMDFACVAASFVVFRNLQIQRKVKWTTIGLMSLGVFTAACSVGKAVTSEFTSPDFSWTQVPVYLWSGAEQYLGIFVTCLPTARPFLLDVIGVWKSLTRLISSRGQTSKSSSGVFENADSSSDQEVVLGYTERFSSNNGIYKA